MAGQRHQIEVSLGRKQGSVAQIRRSHESFDPFRDAQMRPTPYQAYVRIQIGCDKFCTYCIVPLVRGPEQGRPPQDIETEARQLAEQGCLELTLLGQTVNSYQQRSGGVTTRLVDLICRLHDIPGLRRIKFVTNYPKDMTPSCCRRCAICPNVRPICTCPRKADRTGPAAHETRLLGRRISRDDGADPPDGAPAAVSSDFIVGFSGETEDDFQQTVQLVRTAASRTASFSSTASGPVRRPGERLPDDVPLAVKKRRNQQLLQLQNAISEEDNQPFIGQDVEVLVEGPARLPRRQDSRDPASR